MKFSILLIVLVGLSQMAEVCAQEGHRILWLNRNTSSTDLDLVENSLKECCGGSAPENDVNPDETQNSVTSTTVEPLSTTSTAIEQPTEDSAATEPPTKAPSTTTEEPTKVPSTTTEQPTEASAATEPPTHATTATKPPTKAPSTMMPPTKSTAATAKPPAATTPAEIRTTTKKWGG